MNKKVVFSIVAFCMAMSIMGGSLRAQSQFGSMHNDRLGTAAAMELLIPVGARDLAMGGAGIATSTGVDAVYWNPGGLGRMSRSAEGLFSSMAYIADIRVNYGAVGLKFGNFGTVALSIKALDYGSILLTTVDDPEGIAGRTFSPTFIAVGLSYARAFTDAITAGGTVQIINQNFHRVNGSGVAVDIGVQYHGVAGFTGLNLGVVLKNFGPQMKYGGPGLLRIADPETGRRPAQFFGSEAASWELPSSIEMGLAYEYVLSEELRCNINGTFANNNLALDGYRMGGEVVYAFGQLTLSGRGGIELLQKEEFDEQIYGPTFGFGMLFKNPSLDITVDYAYRTVDFFNKNSMFSFKLGF